MGVPGFFAWLLKNYKKSILTVETQEVDYLFLDFNGLIHPVCFRVIDENKDCKDCKNLKTLENLMIEKILEYLDFIVNYVNPKKCLYIAIDGVCPLTKMKHQRHRRYKSVYDHEVITKLKQQHEVPIYNFWTNASITPGTKFMLKLTEALKSHITSHLKQKVKKIIFSTAQTPGEGEHKIMNFIKRSKFSEKISLCVYGLDADLIFLSLATNRPNIFLLREYKELCKGVSEIPFAWVIIDNLKESVKNVIKNEGVEHDNVIYDFIVLCYLLGNDFIPRIPNLNIHNNGIDLIIEIYKEVYAGKPLVDISNGINIDLEFLTRIFEKLKFKENSYFRKQYQVGKLKNPRSGDDFNSDLWNYENMRFQYEDPVQLGSDEPHLWRKRYYDNYFGEKNINPACQKYIEGLFWIANYYFKDCISWHWYYHYDVAPFVSDIHHFLTHGKLREIKFQKNRPLQPLEQLLIVIPPQLDFLVPKAYRTLYKTDLKNYALEKFEIDNLNKNKQYEASPVLPFINLKLIRSSIKKVKLNKEETDYLEKINTKIPDYVFK